MIHCGICNKKVNIHNRNQLPCMSCLRHYHIKCLPEINHTDDAWLCPSCLQNELPFNHVDDDDLFINCLSELYFNDTHIYLLL